MLNNKLGITSEITLANEEERITKIKALVKDTEIMFLLKNALTDKINNRVVYMKG